MIQLHTPSNSDLRFAAIALLIAFAFILFDVFKRKTSWKKAISDWNLLYLVISVNLLESAGLHVTTPVIIILVTILVVRISYRSFKDWQAKHQAAKEQSENK